MIEQLQQSFDMGQDAFIDGTLFTPDDSHIVLAIYDKLDDKNKGRMMKLALPKMKRLCSEI